MRCVRLGRRKTSPTCDCSRGQYNTIRFPGRNHLPGRSHLSPVATCRQTVEALFAPHHRLAADGYDSQRIATTTIHQRILFARQLMHDAVDWKIIEENPFLYPNFRNHRTHRTHGNKSSPRYVMLPCVPWFPCARNAKNPRKNRMASPRHYLLKTNQRAVPLDADTYGSKTDFRECINDGFEFLAREKP